MSPLSPQAQVDVEGAMRAFDNLGAYGPRIVMNELRSLATDAKNRAQANAPGKLRFGWRVEEMANPDTNETFGFGVALDDKTRHGGKPVARWANYGTGDKADGRKVRDGNRSFKGQRPQRFLRRPSTARQQQAAQRALLRAARRAGFEVAG